ncbi:MAG: transposase [Akkermansiaceae bacterium]
MDWHCVAASDFSDWPHAPEHRLGGHGAFMVTAGTYEKAHLFDTDHKLDSLCGGLHKYAQKYQWRLQAWAVFSNHYHFVATTPEAGAENLKDLIREFHSRSARWLNKQDGATGRKVWHNY